MHCGMFFSAPASNAAHSNLKKWTIYSKYVLDIEVFYLKLVGEVGGWYLISGVLKEKTGVYMTQYRNI